MNDNKERVGEGWIGKSENVLFKVAFITSGSNKSLKDNIWYINDYKENESTIVL